MRVVVAVTEGPASGKTFTFTDPDIFLFGRAKDARVSLPDDPYVSRHHFMLQICPPHCRVADLESKNGTFVDGLRYGGKKPLEPGARQAPDNATSVMLSRTGEIVVGDTKLRVTVETDALPDGGMETVADPDSPKHSKRGTGETTDNIPSPAPRPDPSETAPAKPQKPTIARRNPFEVPSIPPMPTSIPTLLDQPAPPPNAGGDNEFSPLLPSDKKAEGPPQYPGYRVERILGRGGMGIVYEAVQVAGGRKVAIKALLPNREVSFQNFRTFHREIEVTRQLKHRNIVEMIDTGNVKGSYYCVLEFVDGMDLRNLTKEKGGRISLKELAPIMLGALDGLAFAHRAVVSSGGKHTGKTTSGIVHRDLKPENILLQRTGDGWIPKVADFGLAKSFESAGMSDMTMDGVCGTPIYWPREQLTHYRYLHPATDVFSMASVFYEILTGQWARPTLKELFEQCRRRGSAPGLADFMRCIAGNPIPPIRQIEPSIPAPVAAVLDRALQEVEVPSDQVQMRDLLERLRYADAGGFRDHLAEALKAAGYIA